MNTAFVVVPPTVVRKTEYDINRLIPDLELMPHHTHGELDEYFAGPFGDPLKTHGLTVTAYPKAIAKMRVLDENSVFAPMPEDLPILRKEFRDQGLIEPSPYFKIIGFAPVILVYHKNMENPPQGWADLCDERYFGNLLCPPFDTPMPAMFRSVMANHFGDQGIKAYENMVADKYPLDINKAVDDGDYLAGLTIPSFGRTFRSNNGAMVWPSEGAVPAPLCAMIRKDASPQAHKALRFLLSPEYQTFLSQTGALCPVHENAPLFPEMKQAQSKMLWDGWDEFFKMAATCVTTLD